MMPELDLFTYVCSNDQNIMHYFRQQNIKYNKKLGLPVAEEKKIYFAHLLYEHYRIKDSLKKEDLPSVKWQLMLLKQFPEPILMLNEKKETLNEEDTFIKIISLIKDKAELWHIEYHQELRFFAFKYSLKYIIDTINYPDLKSYKGKIQSKSTAPNVYFNKGLIQLSHCLKERRALCQKNQRASVYNGKLWLFQNNESREFYEQFDALGSK